MLFPFYKLNDREGGVLFHCSGMILGCSFPRFAPINMTSEGFNWDPRALTKMDKKWVVLVVTGIPVLEFSIPRHFLSKWDQFVSKMCFCGETKIEHKQSEMFLIRSTHSWKKQDV